MRSHFLLGSTFAATLAVAALGFADPPPGKGGASVGVSMGGNAATPSTAGARPATSASAGFSASAGGAAPAGSAAVAARADNKSRPSASPYAAALTKGHGAYMARDYPAAMQAYKEAIAQDGSDPLAYYFLGEAQIAGGSTVEADASFAAGLRFAGSKDDVRGKLLFVIADLRERQGKWPEAKKAWEEYAQFLATHPGVKGYAATATERVKVVDARVDLDAKYAPVRQRIEDRIKENASVPPAADETPRPAPPPAKKK
jgi:tetratricopeptide (TPR) repeat protein